MEETFIVNLSEKDGEDAIREISLKTKSFISKPVKIFFIFFTPHYQASMILEGIKLILRPEFIFGLQSPFLIFEDRIVEKGIIGCCINKEILIKENIINLTKQNSIELSLRRITNEFIGEKRFFFASIPLDFDIYECLRTFGLSLGFGIDIFGGGFIRKYSDYNYQITNTTLNGGLLSIIGSGIDIDIYKICGFLPIGKPFVLNKVLNKQRIIREINGKEPISIFKHYLGEKLEIFKENKLFVLYPFIIKHKEEDYLISIVDLLDDGSLIYFGDVKENIQANIAIFNPDFLFNSINELKLENKIDSGLVFIINSISRKKILKNYANEEISMIRRRLSDRCKIIGIYLDYSFFSNIRLRRITMDTGSVLLTFWK